MDDYDEQDLYENLDNNNNDGLNGQSLDDAEIEMAGSLDGESDALNRLPLHSGYGSSIDLNDLTDEQRNLYDSAYYAGHDTVNDPDEDF